MIGVVLTFTTISYILIFPCLVKLRKSHPDVHRPYRVPGGMAGVWVCTILTTVLGGVRLDRGDLPRASWTGSS